MANLYRNGISLENIYIEWSSLEKPQVAPEQIGFASRFSLESPHRLEFADKTAGRVYRNRIRVDVQPRNIYTDRVSTRNVDMNQIFSGKSQVRFRETNFMWTFLPET